MLCNFFLNRWYFVIRSFSNNLYDGCVILIFSLDISDSSTPTDPEARQERPERAEHYQGQQEQEGGEQKEAQQAWNCALYTRTRKECGWWIIILVLVTYAVPNALLYWKYFIDT